MAFRGQLDNEFLHESILTYFQLNYIFKNTDFQTIFFEI